MDNVELPFSYPVLYLTSHVVEKKVIAVSSIIDKRLEFYVVPCNGVFGRANYTMSSVLHL